MRTAFIVIGILASASVIPAGGEENIDTPDRLEFSEKDLPKEERDPAGLSEVEQVARRRGFNYARVTHRAARGDAKALKQFFALAEDVDGAAAESYEGMPTVVYHLLGDAKFAQFLATQPAAFQVTVRNTMVSDGLPAPARIYFPRYFPETAKLLFRREMVGWPSPDKRCAIRKVFSDEFDLRSSKVERAELIDPKTGQVLLDLTRDDIGAGGDREGNVLWSPDAQRFAYFSGDLTQQQGNLFSTPRPPPHRKQTAVYQRSGETFVRIEMPFGDVPGREKDEELQGAILGHDYIEPVKWMQPNILLLERHEYYEKLKPTVIGDMKFESIHEFARWYRITATIAPDGTAALVWKLREQ